MAEKNFQILWVNEASFLASVRKAREAVGDLTPAMRLITQDFYDSEKSVFERKGPGPYEDLKTSYKAEKQRRWGFVYPINRASGRLMQSVTNPSSPDAISKVTATQFIVGTRVPYGIFVQRRRPFLFMPGSGYDTNQTKNRVQRWSLILKSYVAQTLAKRAVTKA
jgi:hypothetical protein